MARRLPVSFRRCGLRMLLALGATYFLSMYVFHSGLQESGGTYPSRKEWNRMEIGGDVAAADTHRRKSPRDVDLQKAFDRMQVEEREEKYVERFRPKFAQRNEPEIARDRQPNAKTRLEVRIEPAINVDAPEDNWKQYNDDWRLKSPQRLPPDFLDDANIPRNCQVVSGESEFQFQRITSDVFLFSAFWDSRPNDFDNRHNGSFIRIMAIKPKGARPTLGCLFDETTHVPDAELALKSRITYYEMCENHGRSYGGFILSCPVPPTVTVPQCSVTIAHVIDGAVDQTIQLRIRTLDPAPTRRNFAICVPPLFGSVTGSRLVEFLELVKILGAEHVTMYDFNLASEARSLLKFYSDETGFVTVIPWRLDRRIDEGLWYHGQLISIQDCLYRSMASANYVAFHDIDEYIVPRNSTYWTQMLRELEKPKRCAFQFKSAFFRPSRDAEVADNGKSVHGFDLQTLLHLERSSNFDQIRTKCMAKAFSIFEMGIHHVSKPIWADLEVHRVNAEVAFLHHYRLCIRGMGMNCAAYQIDERMLRYKNELNGAVNSTKFTSKHLFL